MGKACFLMDMPDGCSRCGMENKKWCKCILTQKETLEWQKERPKWCPLMEVYEDEEGKRVIREKEG